MCWTSVEQRGFYILCKTKLAEALVRHGFTCNVTSFRRTLRNYGFVTSRESSAVEHEHFNGKDSVEQLARVVKRTVKRKGKDDAAASPDACPRSYKRKLFSEAGSPDTARSASPVSPEAAVVGVTVVPPEAEAEAKRARVGAAADSPDVASLLSRMRELERALAATQATVRSDAEEIRALREENAQLRAASTSPVSAASPLSAVSPWSSSPSPVIDFSLDDPSDVDCGLSPLPLLDLPWLEPSVL